MPVRQQVRLRDEAGFTLAELMVANVITLIVVGAAVAAFGGALRASEIAKARLSVFDNTRIGLDLMVRDFIQVAQGLPAGKTIPVPNGGGAVPISRPGPSVNGTPLAFPAGMTEFTAVIPGDGLGPAINGQQTDIVTVLYADSQFDDVSCDVLVDGSALTANAGTPLAGVADPVQPGDLVMVSNGIGATIQRVTRLNVPPDQTIYFDSPDTVNGTAMNLNQTIAASGTLAQLNPSPGGPAATFTASMFRIRMITYYVDVTTDPALPRLVRQLNLNPPRVVAFGIENLQFTYDLVDGVTNPADLPNPATPNQIRKGNIAISVRSRDRSTLTNDFLRTTIGTQVSFRSLALVDRYPG